MEREKCARYEEDIYVHVAGCSGSRAVGGKECYRYGSSMCVCPKPCILHVELENCIFAGVTTSVPVYVISYKKHLYIGLMYMYIYEEF